MLVDISYVCVETRYHLTACHGKEELEHWENPTAEATGGLCKTAVRQPHRQLHKHQVQAIGIQPCVRGKSHVRDVLPSTGIEG